MVSWVRGKCVGKGSFGSVNLAFNKQTGAVFAVKTASEANQVQALDNEIKILSSLSSPYIVKFLGDDVSFESSRACRNLHMEYLPGGTVADLASSTRRFADVNEETVRSFTYCIVSALKYIHSRGIVHCDVKGRNILLGHNFNSIKLADFGSAIGSTSGEPVLPRGSPLWMAPEVIKREYQGPESDVWSLGCTIIEMVTGKPAWEDHGADSLSRIGFSNELPELPRQLSVVGQDFLKKCLKREPSQRWSCDQLLEHPFLASVSPDLLGNELSPRCVLDWLYSDFEEDIDVTERGTSSSFESIEVSARNRIGKLVGSEGVNWETRDGWVEVRRRCGHSERGEEEELAATSSVCSYDSVWISEEGCIGREVCNSIGSELHVDGPNRSISCGICRCGVVCTGGEGGGCCHYGSQKVELSVEGRGLLVLFIHVNVRVYPAVFSVQLSSCSLQGVELLF
ncbi:MITOGEN-ACTIVATED PROTEIN KINASE KINASE KINASE 14 [Salix viminalis]|uniref:MITOGEN-ACTIVATED PROTEIN KINASE KINASE KINASE 14 n=1 Tax=Salix viminalis TaxID=40686 RepID=A0A9Q0SBL9_SALVM|nr:MITOGEN-ACTIVATED PROTEIN KINASE KINASE KINASE 14 [Salix viminalis]